MCRLCLVISFNLQVILLVLKYKDVNGILVAQSQYFCYQPYVFFYLWLKKRSVDCFLTPGLERTWKKLKPFPCLLLVLRGLQTKGNSFVSLPVRILGSFTVFTCCSDGHTRVLTWDFMVFYAPFLSWVAEAQSFTVTLRDAARQPDIMWGQKNADSLSKLREDKHCELPEGDLLADGMHLAERKFVPNCSDFAYTGMLLWDVAGCWYLDCHCPTAITVNPLLETGDESSLEPRSPKNLHNQPLALRAHFWFAEMAAALWQMYNGNGGMIKGTGGS